MQLYRKQLSNRPKFRPVLDCFELPCCRLQPKDAYLCPTIHSIQLCAGSMQVSSQQCQDRSARNTPLGLICSIQIAHHHIVADRAVSALTHLACDRLPA